MGKKTTVLFLFFVIISLVYSNTINVSWQLDDYPNIVNNSAIHISELSVESLWKSSFSRDGHFNYRPLPNLSFGINWYFGNSNTSGYHIVNILIHVISTFFLFLVCTTIFESPNLKYRFNKEDALFISILATVLWALNPVQTQAVTYIVQRMTIMAAMFYIATIYFYIKARNLYSSLGNDYNKKSNELLFPADYHRESESGFLGADFRKLPCIRIIINYSFCFISSVCAFFSKENVVILPFSIVLVELLFFRNAYRIKNYWKYFVAVFITFTLVISACILILKNGDFFFFLDGYKYRDFSIWERLITEPRIVLSYLSQIFYPLPERFSLIHDVVISRNLFQPWTTIPSFLIIFVIIISGFFQAKKRPLLAFAILFYFLNHLVESTIIPLELVFEHRNYLPSMFIFLPVAWAVNEALKKFKSKNNVVYFFLIITVPAVLIWLGINTYNRNSVWKTELSLWHDAYKKAPDDARPSVSMAISLAFRDNSTPRDYLVAMKLLENALSLTKTKKTMNAEIYGNIAVLYYRMGQFEKSVEFHKKSLDVNPDFFKGRFDLSKTLVLLGRFDEALIEMDKILSYRKEYLIRDHFKVTGHILLWQNRPENALLYFRKAFRMAPWNQDIFLDIGRALSMGGHFRNAEWFLKKFYKNNYQNLFVSLCLIENSIEAGDMISAEKYAEKMLAHNDIVSINRTIGGLHRLYQSLPVSGDIIKPVIMKKILELSGQNYKQ